ncbi:hypothetical protein H632_c2129p0, partial [Helicosporidium sp. ATCC 50920]
MGKGGTKFVADAIGSRSKGKGYTNKDQRKDMETFQATGVHPEVERLRQAAKEAVRPLPDPSPARPHIYLDFQRLIVELFDDVAPSACSAFRARLLPGSSDTFVGGRMLQVTPEESVRGVARGAPASASTAVSAAGTLGFQKQPVLRHTEAGTLSLSLDGAQWALGLAPAPGLDESFQ